MDEKQPSGQFPINLNQNDGGKLPANKKIERRAPQAAHGAPTKIVAMWSGPRNVSTALMYSFAQRRDTAVWDEPYYAAWLDATSQDHPLRDAILAAGPTAPAAVAARISAACDAPVFYQKHMAHHMLPAFDLDAWFDRATHAFLIRPPAAVLASYAAKFEDVSLDLIGLPQQVELFERAADRLGAPPVVIRGSDIQQAPEAALRRLTGALGLEFDPAMLAWTPGPKPYDGVWAPHWYDKAWASACFVPSPAPDAAPALPARLADIALAAQPLYRRLEAYALDVQPIQPAG